MITRSWQGYLRETTDCPTQMISGNDFWYLFYSIYTGKRQMQKTQLKKIDLLKSIGFLSLFLKTFLGFNFLRSKCFDQLKGQF